MQKVCIVVPCFNEENRFNSNYLLEFSRDFPDIYFCLVNDGSSDSTIDLLKQLQNSNHDNFLVIDQSENKGKAEAVRRGVLEAFQWQNFDFVGFWDADFSTPLEETKKFLELFEANSNINLVIGSRIKRIGATITRNAKRHYLGRVFSTFSGLILKLPVYDSQCGAKIFRSKIVKEVFEKPFKTSWLFDVEILARIRNTYGIDKSCKMIAELPLTEWKEVSGSKIKLIHLLKIPFQLIQIYKIYN